VYAVYDHPQRPPPDTPGFLERSLAFGKKLFLVVSCALLAAGFLHICRNGQAIEILHTLEHFGNGVVKPLKSTPAPEHMPSWF
jgi:hypothetical protein